MARDRASDVMWSKEVAYAVGLITTDGSLSIDGRHIDFTSKELELIEIFKRCLGLENTVGRKYSGYTAGVCYRVQFSDVRLYNWLVRIGLSPNKTRNLARLEIPDEFLVDFLRGHLDGDGYIYTFSDRRWPNSQMLYTNFCSCSRSHLEWIRGLLAGMLGICGTITRLNRILALRYAKQESMILLPRLYYEPDLPCLQRKRAIAESFLNVPR